MLLHFAYADFEEQRRRLDKVKEIYDKFLEQKDADISLCYIQVKPVALLFFTEILA